MTDLFEHEIAETHLFNIKKRVKSKHNKKKRHINNFFKIDSSVTFGSYCHVTADCPLCPKDRGLRLPWKFVDYKGVCRFFL